MPWAVVPRAHLAPGGVWPEGPLAPDAPPGARLGQAVALALAAAMEHRKLGARALAQQAGQGMTHPTILAILDGDRLPAAHTLLLLEMVLKTSLYPADLHSELTEGQHPAP
ncbi:hypothetical protein ACIQC7_17565 [Kitasatospora sp. NPDC088556]|uniref:hypothetical protein n=2 Tax=unclassified Kitasatospora TaxID=2633591 RepID=UPI00381CC25C